MAINNEVVYFLKKYVEGKDIGHSEIIKTGV